MWKPPADPADWDEKYLVMDHCQENLSVVPVSVRLCDDYM